jgi:hypothetical protein
MRKTIPKRIDFIDEDHFVSFCSKLRTVPPFPKAD